MTQTKITSEVRLVSEVLYSGHFEVPWHQRYYDWKVEQVRELLYDLKDALSTNKTCYFLGSIMLVKSTDAQPQKINDGQQRLITLSLLIAAFCRRFARKRPRDKGRETLALRALFCRRSNQTSQLKDTSKYRPRIEPPKNDKLKYVQIIRGYDIGTNGFLTAAWNVIDIFVEKMSRSTQDKFFDFLMQKIEISVLDIPVDVDANSVFEALNARGKPLDDVDLIRNRLYSYFSEIDDATRRDEVHNNLESTGVILRNAKTVQGYFRCYLQCRYGYLQKTRFYREARFYIEKSAGRRSPSDYIFNLVDGLGRNDSIELFRTIVSAKPNQGLERRLPTVSGKRNLAILLREMKRYNVSHPIVFALLHRYITETNEKKKKMTEREIARSLKDLASFVMRTAFVAPKFEPYTFEAAFANCAQTIFEGTDIYSLDILKKLERNDEWNVINDRHFIRSMADMELRDSKKALRYLFGINAKIQVGSDVLREDRCSVEHILPQSQSHWGSWTEFENGTHGDWVYRTGNLVIVSNRENKSDAEFNRNFDAKKNVFENSPIQMTRQVADKYAKWTPKIIEKRSRQLAMEAARTWQFSRRKRS